MKLACFMTANFPTQQKKNKNKNANAEKKVLFCFVNFSLSLLACSSVHKFFMQFRNFQALFLSQRYLYSIRELLEITRLL